ncbi:MAG: hypothetical protein AAFZ87_01330 [Planctomycetota bacterium]
MLVPALTAALALVAAGLPTAHPEEQAARRALVPVSPLEHDFGDAFVGDVLEHGFELRVGDRPIELTDTTYM